MAKPTLYGTLFKTSGLIYANDQQPETVLARHLVAAVVGLPVTSTLGANVSSVTPLGNDVRGGLVIVMGGALAANTKICTVTWAVTYPVAPFFSLTSQTSGVGLTIVNFYSANRTAAAFDLLCEQALATGTYLCEYVVIG